MTAYHYEGSGFESRVGKPNPYSSRFLNNLHQSMVRIRMIEEEIERRYQQDQMKTPIHLVIGQEATSVGACAAMNVQDQLWATHRTHGNYLAKGGDLKAMLSEMHCRANGCAASRGGSMYLIDKSVGMAGSSAIVGGILPIATGAAFAAQMRGLKIANLVFFGDAANEEGATHESINFAVLKNLPIVYFCENNFYSVQSPLSVRQPEVEIYKRAAGFGIHSVLVDGTNVLDVFEATRDAVERAKKGQGPTFIEARVYRYRAHGGAYDDSKSGYRDVNEVTEWFDRADPIQKYENYLASLGVFKKETRNDLETQIQTEILNAFEHALTSPMPVAEDLYRNVYGMG